VRLTNNPSADRNPSWSPDKNKIAFVREMTPGTFDLFVMNADGSDVRRVTTSGGVSDPEWSPDGKRILYVYATASTEAAHDLAIINPNAGESSRTYLKLASFNAQEPAWSPDGSRIAFVAVGENSGSDIMTVKPDGTAPQVLVDGKANFDYNNSPSWSPDGRWIAVYVCQMDCDGGSGIMVVDATTGRVGSIPQFAGFGSGVDYGDEGYAPRWSADGSVIAYENSPLGPGTRYQRNLYYVTPDGGYRGIIALRAWDASWRPTP
jgi:Tol biopolymer transport system component